MVVSGVRNPLVDGIRRLRRSGPAGKVPGGDRGNAKAWLLCGKKSEAQSRFVRALGSLVNNVERAELAETARTLLAELTLEEYFQEIVNSEQECAIEFLSVPMFNRLGDLLGAITVGGFQRPLSGREVLEMAGRLSERGKRISNTHSGGPVAV
jgi:hypothetical protein